MTAPYPLKSITPREWIPGILQSFDSFLLDHAACEKKAASLAISLIVKYPEYQALIAPMISLAREELLHFRQVFKLIQKRGLALPQKDEKDHYINLLLAHLRHGRSDRFLDQLVVSGLIEARGSERFGLLAQNLEDPDLKKFYTSLAEKESGHFRVFIRVAQRYYAKHEVDEAIERISHLEAEAMAQTPFGPRLH